MTYRSIYVEQLTLSKRNVPHYYLTIDGKPTMCCILYDKIAAEHITYVCNVVNLESALKLRSKMNTKAEEDKKISLNDIFIKAAAMVSLTIYDLML